MRQGDHACNIFYPVTEKMNHLVVSKRCPLTPKQGTRQYLRVYQRGVPSVLVRVGAVKNWTYCNTSGTALRHKSLICIDEYVFLHKFYDKTASIALKSTNGVKIFKTADETAVPGSNPSFCTVKTQN